VAALLAAQRSVEKDKNPSASSLPSPFFARNSLVGAFVCQLELDCHGLDFPAHQRLYADWRAFSTSGEQGLEEAELIELSAEWKGWDVRAVAEKLALGAKWSKNAKNNEKNNILAQKSNKAELKAEKLVKTKGLMEEETEEEMELG
jgi:hypothetical protein